MRTPRRPSTSARRGRGARRESVRSPPRPPCWCVRSSWIVLPLRLQAREALFHAVEARFPGRALLIGPCADRSERLGVELARSVLRVSATLHEPGAFEHLEVLGDR